MGPELPRGNEVEDQKSGDQYYLVIVANNGETLCHTENYTRKETAKHCAEVLKTEAAHAQVLDETKPRT